MFIIGGKICKDWKREETEVVMGKEKGERSRSRKNVRKRGGGVKSGG